MINIMSRQLAVKERETAVGWAFLGLALNLAKTLLYSALLKVGVQGGDKRKSCHQTRVVNYHRGETSLIGGVSW